MWFISHTRVVDGWTDEWEDRWEDGCKDRKEVA
jgi:hypothetical protein